MAGLTRVAVVGASGFIGNRTVEMLHLGGKHEVVPVVRRPAAMALPRRFDLAPRLADTLDEGALRDAFAGCDAVVAAAGGDPRAIVASIRPLYLAAEAAGVRRIVYLSSAAVHGQAPRPGTDEGSALRRRQPFTYNRAKAIAESRLRAMRRRGATEIVILRPGIVHGPRSQWTGGLADQLLAGTAFLGDGGAGICNGIYVDNLVHAIDRALFAQGADGEAFLVSDAEAVTWRALVTPVAGALGIALEDIPQPSCAALLAEREPLLRGVLFSSARWAFRKLPGGLAHAVRAARTAARERKGQVRQAGKPAFSRELALLHSCTVRLPSAKAERILGYEPPIAFDEACRRSIAWLRFAGYPVR